MNRYASLYQHFSRRAGLVAKVAARWALANMNREYDIMVRLQALEGAMGMTPGAWWTKGRRGLELAKHAAHTKNVDVDPSWFDPMISGLIVPMNQAVAMQSRGTADSTSVLNRMLMLKGKRGAFTVLGEKYDNLVAKPVTDAFGLFVNTTKFYVLKEMKTNRGKEVGEGVLDYQDQKERGLDRVEDTSAGSDIIAQILTDEGSLGKEVRGLMRKVFEPSSAMTVWVDLLEQNKRIPSLKETAEAAGISAQTMTQTHWQKWMPRFYRALEATPGLRSKIEARLMALGAEADELSSYESIFLSGDFGAFRGAK